jgi:hypothetical protein
MERFPVITGEAASQTSRERIDELVHLRTSLGEQLASARNPDDKTNLSRRIDATDRRIDRLVYELYGLTDGEIAIVEAAGE